MNPKNINLHHCQWFHQTHESERQILMIYIKNKNIYVEIKSKEVHFDMNIPSNTWTMITIELIPNFDNDSTNISLYINNKQIITCQIDQIFAPESDVNCFINNVD